MRSPKWRPLPCPRSTAPSCGPHSRMRATRPRPPGFPRLGWIRGPEVLPWRCPAGGWVTARTPSRQPIPPARCHSAPTGQSGLYASKLERQRGNTLQLPITRPWRAIWPTAAPWLWSVRALRHGPKQGDLVRRGSSSPAPKFRLGTECPRAVRCQALGRGTVDANRRRHAAGRYPGATHGGTDNDAGHRNP